MLLSVANCAAYTEALGYPNFAYEGAGGNAVRHNVVGDRQGDAIPSFLELRSIQRRGGHHLPVPAVETSLRVIVHMPDPRFLNCIACLVGGNVVRHNVVGVRQGFI